MNQTFDLGHIYKNREEFIVIGLTGRTGAGCSFVSSIFSKESLDESFPAGKHPSKCIFPISNCWITFVANYYKLWQKRKLHHGCVSW